MPSGRGLVVLGAGLVLWAAARLVGSPDLHIVAAGVVALPFAAALFVRWNRQRLTLTRRLSATKLWPGQRLNVELEVSNRSAAATSFVLLEDRLPAGLGRPARLALTGLPGRNAQRVRYTTVCRTRGRYSIGPATAHLTDPFALTKVSLEFPAKDEVVVFPDVEDLTAVVAAPHGAGAGESASRQLFRTGDEFYTMREYQIGDDLRRIHWPSVARRGRLMIRQDETARRSSATVFLDTRVNGLGQANTPGFEKGVSVAASVGMHLAKGGFALRMATTGGRATSVTEERFLEGLAQVGHSPARPLGAALLPLRTSAIADSTLVVVCAPPSANEVAALTRVGTAYGAKVSVLVHPHDPATLPPEQKLAAERQASAAMLSLARAGWDVIVLPPQGKLQDVWHVTRKKLPAGTASST